MSDEESTIDILVRCVGGSYQVGFEGEHLSIAPLRTLSRICDEAQDRYSARDLRDLGAGTKLGEVVLVDERYERTEWTPKELIEDE